MRLQLPALIGWRTALHPALAAVVWVLLAASPPLHAQAPAFNAYISSGLSAPVAIANAHDTSGRLFVAQQGGSLRVVRNNVLQPTALLTLDGATQCKATPSAGATTVGFTNGGERGLLGLAFHPSFASNGQLFISFTDVNADTLIARFTMATPSADVMSGADLASCVVMLRVDQDGANHNGGNIVFGPDGFLYIGMGDGGGNTGSSDPNSSGGGDSCNRAQTLDPGALLGSGNCASDTNFTNSGGNANSRALLGKMLRINVDAVTAATPGSTLCAAAADGSANYAIPAGNPFTGADPSSACDEVWSYGLRNPWRWSFDRQTNDLIIGDVGQGSVEEIDFELPNTGGTNYGWHCYEGNNTFTSCNPMPINTPPIITYGHSAGRCSITGGYRYRGPVLGVQGDYFYADYCTGEIWNSQYSGSAWSQPGVPFADVGNVTTFGEDEAGNLYVTSGSQILRLEGATVPPDEIFFDGYE